MKAERRASSKLQWITKIRTPRQSSQTYERKIHASETELLDENFQRGLCARCRKIRWAALADAEVLFPPMDYDLFEIMLNTENRRQEFLNSSCKLCRFLASFNSSIFLTHDRPSLHVERATGGTSISPILNYYNGYISTFRIGIRSQSPNKDFAPLAIGPTVNYDVIHEWLSHCHEFHPTACQSKGTVEIPGFKVINCATRIIEPAPGGCSYVALSYVWGTVDHDGQQSGFPPTIDDSISVTLKMGMKYLWVDRYCIDQVNQDEKDIQIANMDIIYSKAQFTIIAAAGSDPYYGLPGVRSRLRKGAKRVQIGDIHLIHMPVTIHDFWGSPWAKRGWTFQEGMLSNRLLVFTDTGVLFSCREMCCSESIQQKLHHLSIRGSYDAKVTNLSSTLSCILQLDHEQKPNIWTALADYSGRNLKYESDFLNACQGILNAFSESHVWGMPLMKDSSGRGQINLQWHPECWPSHRRSGFPTWSWASVNSRIGFENGHENESPIVVDFATIDGQWQTIDMVMQHNGPHCRNEDYLRTIRIRAPRIPNVCLYYDEENVRADMPYGAEVLRMDLDTYLDEPLEQDELSSVVALLTYYTSKNSTIGCFSVKYQIWLIRPSESIYRRVGFIYLRMTDLVEASFTYGTSLKNSDPLACLLKDSEMGEFIIE
ncbi:HET-domain-containing protein [Byssothecium circinans]|uniref:HET-domain-containing protein n=1 Tax=Byssothecium circinans TaxID=147558 RepID=A0A6A5TN67_9PLEO|nr:HET-domain-containing protein [Byssothecium circinans]